MAQITKVYLAGPGVFAPDPLAVGQYLKEVCSRYDVEGVFPLDKSIDTTGLEPAQIAQAIYYANIAAIDECDALIANMTPFRGPSTDPGTAFEMGYAKALGKPVIGYTENPQDYLSRVREFYSGSLSRGNGWRDPRGMEVEDFGLTDNLMMASSTHALVQTFEEAVRIVAKEIS